MFILYCNFSQISSRFSTITRAKCFNVYAVNLRKLSLPCLHTKLSNKQSLFVYS